MVTRIIAAMSFCILSLIAGAVHAGVSEDVERIPAGLESVFYCGNWKDQGKEGFVRFVFVYTNGHSEAFIQWLAVGASFSPDEAKLVASTSVREFSGEAAYTITSPRCLSPKNGESKVSLHADNANEHDGTHGTALYKVEVFAGKPGSYKLTWRKQA